MALLRGRFSLAARHVGLLPGLNGLVGLDPGITFFEFGRSHVIKIRSPLAAIATHKEVSLFERMIYSVAVPAVKKGLLEGGGQFDSITTGRAPWGPGRVDTFNPYKVLVFHADMTADEKLHSGITENMIRLSVVLEDVDDVIEDIRQALDRI